MSLVAGRGPLSVIPPGGSRPRTADPVYVEPHPRRVPVYDRGPVINTERALMVHRRGHPLSYAFPAERSATSRATRWPKRLVSSTCPGRPSTLGSKKGAARALSAQPVSPGRLSPDKAGPARLGRGNRAGRHRRHRNRLRDRARAKALRPPRAGPHRFAASIRDDELLQLQGLCDILVGGSWATTIGRRRRGVELRGPPAGKVPIKGFLSFDATRVDVYAELPCP